MTCLIAYPDIIPSWLSVFVELCLGRPPFLLLNSICPPSDETSSYFAGSIFRLWYQPLYVVQCL